MSADYSTETDLSKDELMDILNEIDSERSSYDRNKTKDHRNEKSIQQRLFH